MIISKIRSFGKDKAGASLAEYAILLAIMAALGATTLPGLKAAIDAKFVGGTNQLTAN